MLVIFCSTWQPTKMILMNHNFVWLWDFLFIFSVFNNCYFLCLLFGKIAPLTVRLSHCAGLIGCRPPSGWLNTLRPRQNGHRFADDTFKRIFLNENVRISIKISLKFVPKCSINNNPALFQIMAWRRSGDKSLSEPMIASLLTHICVTRPQCVNSQGPE